MPPPSAIPRLELIALRHPHAGPFSLALAAGEAIAVTGPSGAGKSLLLRMAADLDPHEGEALLDGSPRSGVGAPDWRRQVTYAAAEPGWWHETVGPHFAAPPIEAAALLGLPPDIFRREIRLCSTGERQRLALLRALDHNPAVLLLDEPTAALDAESTSRVEALLRSRMEGGMAMLIVTHDPAQAARLAHRHLVLAQGHLVA